MDWDQLPCHHHTCLGSQTWLWGLRDQAAAPLCKVVALAARLLPGQELSREIFAAPQKCVDSGGLGERAQPWGICAVPVRGSKEGGESRRDPVGACPAEMRGVSLSC